MLRNELLPKHAEIALGCSALELWHERSLTTVQQRALWIENVSGDRPAVVAVLMRWYARLGAREHVGRLWVRLRDSLQSWDGTSERLEAACLACLALRQAGKKEEAQRLFQRISEWSRTASLDLQFSTLGDLARVFAAFGDLQAAIALNRRGHETPEGVLGEVVSQLVEEDEANAALAIIQRSERSLMPRLLFRFCLQIVKRQAPLNFDVGMLRRLAAPFEEGGR